MEQRKNFIFNMIYYACLALIGFLALRYALPWLWPFWGGLILASMFKGLARKMGMHSKLSAALLGLVFYAAVVLLFWLLIALAGGAIVDFAKDFPQFYNQTLSPYFANIAERFLSFIERIAPSSAVSLEELFQIATSAASEFVSGISMAFVSFTTSFVKRLPLFLIGFVFMIVSSLAIASDYNRVTSFLMRQIPQKTRPVVLDIKNFLACTLFKVFKAYAVIMLITFCELSVGLWALRINRFWYAAAIIAVLDILPLIGSGGVLIPWSILEFINGHLALSAGLLILYAVVAVMRNIIEPHVVGDSLGLHPVVTLAAMFFGLRAIGLLGMLIAPVAVLLIRYLNEKGIIQLYKA